MTTYTKWMISLVSLMLAITALVIWLIQDRFFKSDEISIQEASQKVESLYGGTIESFEQKNAIFYMAIKRNNQLYNLQMDAETGVVLKVNKTGEEIDTEQTASLKTIDEIRALIKSLNKGTIQSITLQNQDDKQQYIVEISDNQALKTIVVHAQTGEILSEKIQEQNATESNNPVIITSEKAKQIALSQLRGSIEYVVYKESSDGGYYLVEVDGEDNEAVFQIHAVSGKVLSVTPNYDSDDDDSDESDDDAEENEDNDENDDDD
ncbi:PepSY domain-containing protein [Lysinibacillus telephonicus]|uniref:PepSY domain-containing protein n=1 Tax=Lysinibacillus telephonicus TaxID=1714840 RepID=A0A431USX3_9BACI|nr:PepSY domain-containing protein [Lysinibacillus telephonicus]RTQ93642.1 hypothetical protein EKG35_07750 [Lysinibacillus telephonicus]